MDLKAWSLVKNKNLWQYEAYVKNPLVSENKFLSMRMDEKDLPRFDKARDILPQPFWSKHETAIDCYWKAWQIAFKNLREPTKESGFVANYIDTAFNDCLFMWDSAFILMFAKYGCRAFDFQCTLDNLYSKQHPDGFICREIVESDGSERFNRFDPSSTGPNIMPWTEWEYYCLFGDRERLERVFPVLAAYHQWLRAYRTWPDGTYWSTGWGCGMDNQPRLPKNMSQEFFHGHLVWIDACLQQVFSAKILLKMSEILGRRNEMDDFQEESKRLSLYINEHLWNEKDGFYYDLHRYNKLSDVKTIGAYWALLAEVVPKDRLEIFVSHLKNTLEFNRQHRVPSLSADHPEYVAGGNYWRGSIWTPTNYMVLRGLNKTGYGELAHEIAVNHHENVVKVFEETGTLWENYAPEYVAPGNKSKPDFVGWSGLPPIAVFFEYVIGLRPDVQNSTLVWDVRLLEEHGVSKYPFGKTGVLNLRCKPRQYYYEKPEITITANIPFKLEIRWGRGKDTVLFKDSYNK